VRKMIVEMASEKVIILSTHILEEVQAICNRVIISNHGKLIVDETPDQLRRRHERYNAMRLSFTGDDLSLIRKTIEGMQVVGKVVEENGSLVAIPKNKENLKETLWHLARAESWPLVSMEEAPAVLDDVFWDLTQS